MKILKIFLILTFLIKFAKFNETQPPAQATPQKAQADTGQTNPQTPTDNKTPPEQAQKTAEKAQQPPADAKQATKEGEAPKEGEQQKPQGDVCKVEILKAYGLQGLASPSTEQLLMFPRITQTCCRQTDQMKIFDQWLRHHQRSKVKQKIEHIENHYKQLIELLSKLEGLVLGVKMRLSHKNIANCKELANRILSFEISDLGPQIMSNIHKMNEFFFEAFSGFYHTLCDFNNHKYFNIEKKEIQYSKKFCRNISKNTLPVLLFFYRDINYYLNLIAKFMTTCDSSGNYTPSVLPENLMFTTDPLIEEVLLECKHDRNTKNWYQKCIPICENFVITNYDKFFEPQYDKITHLFNFLKASFDKFEAEVGQKSLFTNVMPPQENLLGRRRLLAEGDKPATQQPAQQPTQQQNVAQDKPKEGEKKEGDKKEGDKKEGDKKEPKIDNKNLIFDQEPGHTLNLGQFLAVFKDDGIALRENGINTLVSKEIYNEILIIHHDELKALDTEEALEVIDVGGNEAQLKEPKKNAIGGNTISLKVFMSIFALFLIQLFNFKYLIFLSLILQSLFHTYHNIYKSILFYDFYMNFNRKDITLQQKQALNSNLQNQFLNNNLINKNHLLLHQQ